MIHAFFFSAASSSSLIQTHEVSEVIVRPQQPSSYVSPSVYCDVITSLFLG